MAVYKNGNKWYASVYTGMKDGKRIKTSSKGFVTKKEAQLVEIDMKKIVIESNHVAFDKESFINVANTWLATKSKNVAPSTAKTLKTYYDTYIYEYFEKKLIKDIDVLDVVNFQNSLDLSPQTINKIMNMLKQIFDFAISLNYVYSNPCLKVKKPPIKKSKKNTWSPKQIKDFLNLVEVRNSISYTAYAIIFTTGMRPGEVCGLRWCDLHNDYFLPTIGISKYRDETELKNEYAHEKVFIADMLKTHLDKLKKVHRTLYFEHGVEFTDDGFINCLEPDMRPMTPDYLRKNFDRLLKKYDLPKIRLYDARHSLGTNMMRDGVNAKKVAEIMRHSSVKTTLDTYSHVDDDMKKDAMNMYNSQLL